MPPAGAPLPLPMPELYARNQSLRRMCVSRSDSGMFSVAWPRRRGIVSTRASSHEHEHEHEYEAEHEHEHEHEHKHETVAGDSPRRQA